MADGFEGFVRIDLTKYDNIDESLPTNYVHEDTLNPNRLKWRLKWQTVINTVVERNRNSKRLRNEWSQLVMQVMKRKNEQEVEASFRNNNGFRRHNVRMRRIGISIDSCNVGDLSLAVEHMAQYKEEVLSRRKKTTKSDNK